MNKSEAEKTDLIAVVELDYAVKLANWTLDKHDIDPDGNEAVLARQLLRAIERLAEAKIAYGKLFVENCANLGRIEELTDE